VAAASSCTRAHARSTRAWNAGHVSPFGGVVRREHVESELGVGRASEIAEVPLLEQRVERERNAGHVVKALGGGRGAGEVARDDVRDTVVREPASQPLGLRDAAE
jgi:hypothetical protein